MTDEDREAARDALANRPVKTCGGCGATKVRSEFRARPAVTDGLAPQCKACESEYGRSHYRANRDKRGKQTRAWYEANKDERLVKRRAWYAANRERAYANQVAWNKANPGRRAELVREWRAANKSRALASDRAWREANRERLRELSRAQYAANPEKFIDRGHQRRALVRGVTVGEVDYEALWTGRCGICELPMNRELAYPDPLSKSVDHIVPLALGGPHEQSNLQYAHLRCNVAKGAMLLDSA